VSTEFGDGVVFGVGMAAVGAGGLESNRVESDRRSFDVDRTGVDRVVVLAREAHGSGAPARGAAWRSRWCASHAEQSRERCSRTARSAHSFRLSD